MTVKNPPAGNILEAFRWLTARLTGGLIAVALGASAAAAAPLVGISGRVCDGAMASSVRQPEPGEVRCRRGEGNPGLVRVTLSNSRGHTLASTRTRRTGEYRLRIRPGSYVIGVEKGSYSLTVRVRSKSIKNVDFVRGILFIL